MHKAFIRLVVSAFAASTLVGGCASSQTGSVATAPSNRSILSGPEKARADSARLPYVAADIKFMTGMIAHHAQAIVMSRLALTHGAGASIKTLAERIINAQTDEITIMQVWLRDRNQPVPPGVPAEMKSMPGMQHDMSHDMSSHAMMPGMLSDGQMKALAAARGADFDRLFLSGMIQHHQGAVSMVKDLFATIGAGQDETVFKFASDVNIDQTTEIERMRLMLIALITDKRAP